ncbi:MAG: PLP-dependent aminotransferase family protein [Pikeienuella sp.]|uniref:aminotransferase-like domain-containing protein n=1 Tax=Pikeienuella sp. TaxID=2831957 RepID=UPI003918EA9F
MREFLFPIDRAEGGALQAQIRAALERAVASGAFAPGDPAPSTRRLAEALGVSRNTVSLAFQSLVDQGVLEARERSGYFIARRGPAAAAPVAPMGPGIDWAGRLAGPSAAFEAVPRPEGWRAAPFPFIYGQFDPELFPIAEWRDATRRAMGRRWLDEWTEDRYAEDDPMLIEEIRRRILPRRGVAADAGEILVTLGAQNALFLAAALLLPAGSVAAMEEPGYPDARALFRARAARTILQPVDEDGMQVDERLRGARLIYVTPSHQHPSLVSMSLERRRALLALAEEEDAVILEDDYEPEASAAGPQRPALRALDGRGRVLYAGSLSKSMMPGLRLGFLVGARPFIEEARALRRLMLRHPPGMNQRVAALFMAARHHDMLLGRMRRALAARRSAAVAALAAAAPGWRVSGAEGGGGLWIEGPEGLDSRRLAAAALARGVVIEPGDVFFGARAAPRRFFRMGFSVIPEERIGEGVARLVAAAESVI